MRGQGQTRHVRTGCVGARSGQVAQGREACTTAAGHGTAAAADGPAAAQRGCGDVRHAETRPHMHVGQAPAKVKNLLKPC